MNNKIHCPSCYQKITGERFISAIPKRAVWYKFEHQEYRCPHCGISLAYDRRTGVLMGIIAVAFLMVSVLVVVGMLPVSIMLIVPAVLFALFFRVRRLVVRPDSVDQL
ncbi:hypothetical protein [Alcanivorax sediminis]|uniref:Cxxc_20_cxxc protein n=1 Tax=Alcanivorax sediminis TaxID=2663008 RepID=A0A6N7LSK0_9GAMM|nr:hypothetical protein [Alcanivorax sediminis]MQX52286.1 hypothetical protein [Alcanivorax sediminis]